MARKAQGKGLGALPSPGKVPREGGTGRQPSSLDGWSCSSRKSPTKRPGLIQDPLSNTGQAPLPLQKAVLEIACSAWLCVSSFHLTLYFVSLCGLLVPITHKFSSSFPGYQTGPGMGEVLNNHLLREALPLAFTLCGTPDLGLLPSDRFRIHLNRHEAGECAPQVWVQEPSCLYSRLGQG